MTKMELTRLILDIIIILLFLFFTFSKAFFQKKGENLATKKDISEITNKIEKVKDEYNRNFEKYKLELISELSKKNLEIEIKKNVYERLIIVKKDIVEIERLKQLNKSIDTKFSDLFNNLKNSTDYIFQNKIILKNLKEETPILENEINLMVNNLKMKRNYNLSQLNEAIDKYIEALYK